MIPVKWLKGGRRVLVFDFRTIGNKLLTIRKKAGLTQNEVAERSGLSDRTYADIERGTVNMRIETVLRICKALQITPDDILIEENTALSEKQAELLEMLASCTSHEQETALQLLSVYLHSLKSQ